MSSILVGYLALTELASVFEARLTALLNNPDGSELDSLLCGIALSGLDFPPYLNRIARVESAALAVYEQNAKKILERHLTNGFWQDRPPVISQMIDWFYSAEMSSLILKFYGVDLHNLRPRDAS